MTNVFFSLPSVCVPPRGLTLLPTTHTPPRWWITACLDPLLPLSSSVQMPITRGLPLPFLPFPPPPVVSLFPQKHNKPISFPLPVFLPSPIPLKPFIFFLPNRFMNLSPSSRWHNSINSFLVSSAVIKRAISPATPGGQVVESSGQKLTGNCWNQVEKRTDLIFTDIILKRENKTNKNTSSFVGNGADAIRLKKKCRLLR